MLPGIQSLLEDEEMFSAPVALEGTGDGVARSFDAMIFEGGQLLGIPLARQNRFQDGQTGHAGQVADDVVELEIHLRERFLQVLHMAAGITGEVGPMAQEGTHGTNLFGRPEARAQQADRMQVLNPLAVADVGLAAGEIFTMPRVDQTDFQSGGFKDLKDGNPIDAGGLHGNGLDATGFEPVAQRVQIVGEGGEGPDRVWSGVPRDGDLDFGGAEVDAGGVRMERGQLGVGFGFYFFGDGHRFAFVKVAGGRAAPSV